MQWGIPFAIFATFCSNLSSFILYHEIKHTKPQGTKHTLLNCFVTAVNILPRIFSCSFVSGFLYCSFRPTQAGREQGRNRWCLSMLSSFFAISDICQFWYTIAVFWPLKVNQKVHKFATNKTKQVNILRSLCLHKKSIPS